MLSENWRILPAVQVTKAATQSNGTNLLPTQPKEGPFSHGDVSQNNGTKTTEPSPAPTFEGQGSLDVPHNEAGEQ